MHISIELSLLKILWLFERQRISLNCTHLEAVVGPAAELHDAGLLVEGEVLHVDLARGLVDGGRLPLHEAVVPQRRLGGERHLEVAIRAGKVADCDKFPNQI